MMREYVIMTDSCCDLPAQLAEELGIVVQPMTLFLGEESFRNHLDGRELGFHEFYELLRGGAMPTTSSISVGEFEDLFRSALQEGKDVLYLCFSSGMSTTYQSACIAAESLKEEFPEGKVLCVDSLAASLGQGMLVYLCAQQKKAGKTLEEVHAYAMATRLHVSHWFTVDDLNHLKRGGRVSAATALVGTMLAIKPVLHVDNEGHLIAMSKVRGRAASLQALAKRMKETMTEDPAKATVFISHGDCEEEAKQTAAYVEEMTGAKVKLFNLIGAVIGSHSGPGTMALFFMGNER